VLCLAMASPLTAEHVQDDSLEDDMEEVRCVAASFTS